MEEKIKEALDKIRPRLGSANAEFVNVNGSTLTIKYFQQISACDVKSRGLVTKDVVLEMLEDELSKEVPEITEIKVT